MNRQERQERAVSRQVRRVVRSAQKERGVAPTRREQRQLDRQPRYRSTPDED